MASSFLGLTSASDVVLTSDGALKWQDTDQGVCWNAPQQGVGTYDIIARVAEDGDLETRDYLDLEYSIDGGPYTTLANAQGQTSAHTLIGGFALGGQSDDEDWQHATLRVTDVSPSVSLDVRVCASTNSGAEQVFLEQFDIVTAGSQPVTDVAGWRLLSLPGGGTVADLASLNLVQGVTGQYPFADDNLFSMYGVGATAGAGAYRAAESESDPIEAGAGFMWYWFDADIIPPSGGTSRSYDLAGFRLPGNDSPLTTDLAYSPTRNTTGDDFYMIGNPFSQPLAVSGIEAADGTTLMESFLAYDPALNAGIEGVTSGGYVELTGSDAVAVWQGLFAQVDAYGPGVTDPTFTFDEASRGSSETETFYGREVRPTTVALMLTGTLEGGIPVVDAVTKARFRDGATDGFDRFDFSELAPPNASSAALAFTAERDGQLHRLAIHSMPKGLKGSVTLPVAFATTGAGTFTVSGELVSVPEGWTATLRDLVSGDVVDLRAAKSHTFAADAGEWTSRFELAIAASSSVDADDTPRGVELGLVSPNPTLASATLSLRVDAPQRVTVTVVDALGRSVETPFSDDLAPSSEATIRLDASTLAPGTYNVHVEGETFRQTRRLTVVR